VAGGLDGCRLGVLDCWGVGVLGGWRVGRLEGWRAGSCIVGELGVWMVLGLEGCEGWEDGRVDMVGVLEVCRGGRVGGL
jgi:hypothetical protein